MQLAIAGATHMGGFSFNPSQLDRITRRLRTGWRSLFSRMEVKP